jgi:hypothetical protein
VCLATVEKHRAHTNIHISARNTRIQAHTSVDASRERVTCTQSHQRDCSRRVPCSTAVCSRARLRVGSSQTPNNFPWQCKHPTDSCKGPAAACRFTRLTAGLQAGYVCASLRATVHTTRPDAARDGRSGADHDCCWQVGKRDAYRQTAAGTAYHTVLDSDECSRGLTQPHASSVHCLTHRKNPRAPATTSTQQTPPVYWPNRSPLREVGLHYTPNGITPQSTIQRAIYNHLPEVNTNESENLFPSLCSGLRTQQGLLTKTTQRLSSSPHTHKTWAALISAPPVQKHRHRTHSRVGSLPAAAHRQATQQVSATPAGR